MRYLVTSSPFNLAVWIKLYQIALAFAPATVVANSKFLRTSWSNQLLHWIIR
ncbi:MAG: hypothetical protein MR028_08805 [Ligilactobacillus agilis]|nr:hypothetical protein [Ligilactobacillus agilis]